MPEVFLQLPWHKGTSAHKVNVVVQKSLKEQFQLYNCIMYAGQEDIHMLDIYKIRSTQATWKELSTSVMANQNCVWAEIER